MEKLDEGKKHDVVFPQSVVEGFFFSFSKEKALLVMGIIRIYHCS